MKDYDRIAELVINLAEIDIFENRRTQSIVEARTLFDYIMNTVHNKTLESIASYYVSKGKSSNHSSIYYRLSKFKDLVRRRPEFLTWLNIIKNNTVGSNELLIIIDKIKILNKSHPNVPFLFNIIGASYKALGQLSGAIKMFENAVAIKPDYSEAHKNLGISLKELGKFDAAVISFKKSITLEPNNVDTHYNLAVTLKAMNDLDSAVKSYEKVVFLKLFYMAFGLLLSTIYLNLVS